MVLDLLLGSLFYANTFQTPQLRDSPQQYSAMQQSQSYPKSIDDILRGTRFIAVCSDNYVAETSKGNVVLFAYTQRNIVDIPMSLAMAEVLRRVVDDFPLQTGIRFLKFDVNCDPALSVNNYQRLIEEPYGIPRGTYVAFFRNGRKVLDTPKIVPFLREDVIQEWTESMKSNINNFLLGKK